MRDAKNTEKVFSVGFLLVLCQILQLSTGCTQMTFKSKGLIPLYMTQRVNHKHYREIKGVKEFYLWGLVGPDPSVYMDELFYEQGLLSVANITVQEFKRPWDFWKSFLSLGFYVPKNFKVSGFGVQTTDE